LKQANIGKKKLRITTTDDKSKSKASNHDESDSDFVTTRESPLKIRHVINKDDNNNSFVEVDARISGKALFDINKEELLSMWDGLVCKNKQYKLLPRLLHLERYLQAIGKRMPYNQMTNGGLEAKRHHACQHLAKQRLCRPSFIQKRRHLYQLKLL
jgi:hypothetical protein